MPFRLILCRHGETDWNVEGRMQGHRDIPVNARGRAQAQNAGQVLKRAIADPAAVDFVASPLGRTMETMRLMRASMDLPHDDFTTDVRLMEITFGDWEGLTWREVTARAPDEARARETDKWNFVPPNGESYAMLADRVVPWLEGLTRETVAVTHGGIMRFLLAHMAGIPTRDAPLRDIPQGRPLVIEDGRYRWL